MSYISAQRDWILSVTDGRSGKGVELVSMNAEKPIPDCLKQANGYLKKEFPITGGAEACATIGTGQLFLVLKNMSAARLPRKSSDIHCGRMDV